VAKTNISEFFELQDKEQNYILCYTILYKFIGHYLSTLRSTELRVSIFLRAKIVTLKCRCCYQHFAKLFQLSINKCNQED
jgi:hypothetical protein